MKKELKEAFRIYDKDGKYIGLCPSTELRALRMPTKQKKQIQGVPDGMWGLGQASNNLALPKKTDFAVSIWRSDPDPLIFGTDIRQVQFPDTCYNSVKYALACCTVR